MRRHQIRRAILWLGLMCGAIALILSCSPPQAHVGITRHPECVQSYDPQFDYFPDKVVLEHAKGFEVEYHKHYKLVTVRNPWRDAKVQFQYVLVQCGTPTPKGFASAQVIQVPVQRIAIMSSTHLAQLQALNLLDRVVGVSRLKQIYGKNLWRENQTVVEVGNSETGFNLEKLLDLSPDLITTFGTGNPARDTHPKLLEAGLKVGIVGEYMEPTALGQTEWMKFMALFFNRENEATQQFKQIVQQYQQVKTLASRATNQPTVLTGFSRGGTWFVPGGNSYVAQFLRDAGANYLWASDRSSGSLPLSFETVYDRAISAEFWLNGSRDWKKLQDVRQADERYQTIKAVQVGQVFNNNARVNEFGGNDYWQSGIVQPHVVLLDLVKIFHPELLPKHQLVYYRALS